MLLRNKIIILCLVLTLYPVARWIDHQDKSSTASQIDIYARTTNNRDSLYDAITECLYFVGDSQASFNRDGFITYFISGNKYRTHLIRDSIILEQDMILIIPKYLERFDSLKSNKIINRSYGQYDLLGLYVSSCSLAVTPYQLYLMLKEYKLYLHK